jgi:hypothetical protein
MPKGMQPIYTREITGSATTSVTFNNIPQTYTDLLVRCSWRSANNSAGYTTQVLLNGVGSNGVYSHRTLQGTGSAAGSINAISSGISYGYGGQINEASTTSGIFTSMDVYIPNYTSTMMKQFLVEGVAENNATTAYQFIIANLSQIESPVTSLYLSPFSQTLVDGSTITLYGIGR